MYKHFVAVRNCALALALCAGFTACSDDDDDDSADVTLNVAAAGFQYDETGVWNSVYTNDQVNIQGLNFAHTGGSQEYYGTVYYTWGGFVPSSSSDKTDYSNSSFIGSHEWSAIAGSGVSGSQYMVGYWNCSEDINAPEDAATYITYANGATFEPKEVYVTNTTYAYYTMLNGNAFAKKFTSSDWFDLTIHGALNNETVSEVTVRLANGTDIADNWIKVDLSALGSVDRIYFTMTSSDTGQWGMNNPAYFCLDRLAFDID